MITEEIREVVNAMGTAHYMYGTRKEINKRLTQKVNRYDKYPLIVLYTPITGVPENGMMKYDLTLSILEFTKRELNAEQRMADKFATVLLPLYEQFLEELRETGGFAWEGDLLRPPHTMTKVPYWGVEEGAGKSKNYYTDPLDAIVISGLQINSFITCPNLEIIDPVIPAPVVNPPEGSMLQFINGEWVAVPLDDVANQIANVPIE